MSRMQWLGLDAPLQLYSLSADIHLPYTNFSIGGMVNRATEGYIRTMDYSLILATNLEGRDWFVNWAAQIRVGNRKADRNNLLFPDQIDQNGPTGQPSQAEPFALSGKTFGDLSLGVVFTYRRWMLGYVQHHLLKPEIGIIGSGEYSKLQHRYVVHISYVLGDIPDNYYTLITKLDAILDRQGNSKLFTLSSLFDLQNSPLEFSLSYKNNLGIRNSHGIGLGVNIKIGNRRYHNPVPESWSRIGVGYDAYLTSPSIMHTKGSAELSILHEIGKNECPKPHGLSDLRYPWVFH